MHYIKTDKQRLADMPQMMKDTVKQFHKVKGGKGSRWRTLPNEKYKEEYDRIFRKKKVTPKKKAKE